MVDAPFNPEDLLRALWLKHVRTARQTLGQELGNLIVKQAASGLRIDVGSLLYLRWDVERMHLEATIKATLADFDQRAEPSASTLAFLQGGATDLLAGWARTEARLLRFRDGGRIDPSEMPECNRNLDGLALHFETVAAAEVRVLAASARFAAPRRRSQMLMFDRELQLDQPLPEDYRSIVRGESLKRGLVPTIIEQTSSGLLLQVQAADPGIANKPDLATQTVDDLLVSLPHALAQNRLMASSRGDTYLVHQAGAVGPHARAESVVNQSYTLSAGVDLAKLADELGTLRVELRRSAETAEHDEATGAIATAEKAAKNGDRSGTATALAKVGTWVWDKASTLGLDLLKEYLSKKAGL
jgi:hypothetical protein